MLFAILSLTVQFYASINDNKEFFGLIAVIEKVLVLFVSVLSASLKKRLNIILRQAGE
jgi:hypothetical protein